MVCQEILKASHHLIKVPSCQCLIKKTCICFINLSDGLLFIMSDLLHYNQEAEYCEEYIYTEHLQPGHFEVCVHVCVCGEGGGGGGVNHLQHFFIIYSSSTHEILTKRSISDIHICKKKKKDN